MVRSNFILILILVLLSGSMPALASEVDQFTQRFVPLADSSVVVNRRLNEMLQVAVDGANRLEEGKRNYGDIEESEKRLYKEMRKLFNNHTKSEFVRDLLDKSKEDDGIERQRILKADSIFSEWKLLDGIIIGLGNADESSLAIAPLIRMGEVTIGIDKLEHIFERGWLSFDRKYRRGQSDRRVIYMSNLGERVIFGGNIFVTGVFSHADIVANFNGMRFWNDVLQKENDILGKHENGGPYVFRVQGHWQVNAENPIDLNHYIDWGMDEGINCSRFATRRTERKVNRALSNLNERDPDHTYAYPMDSGKFDEISKKYGKFSKMILNQHGISRR